MKVVHVITDLAVGGAEMMLYRLLTRADPALLRPTVVCLQDGTGLAKPIEDLGVPVHTFGLRWRSRAAGRLWSLAELLRRLRPDILQGWMCHGNLAAQAASVFARSPTLVLWNIRNSLHDLSQERRATAAVIHILARVSSWPRRIVYNSRESARQHERLGYDSRRTVVIPNGFDCDVFRPRPEVRAAVRGALGIPEEAPLIGLVARLHPVKDHVSFLRAAAELAAQGHPARFLLVGRGTDAPQLASEIDGLGLQGRVHALGERADIPELMASLDIATCCSVAEAFPNVVGEAMASEVPCVVTDVGDSAWLVGDTGRVIPPRDPVALARAWRDLLALPAEQRRSLGESARRRILHEFSLDSVVARYEALYREVFHG